MKIAITLSNSEKSYISRAVSKIAPACDQSSIWSDMDQKYPAFRSIQQTTANGDIEATLDINSEFVMDVVDVAAEVCEKVKSFGFMMKGVMEGFAKYGKEVSKRFEKWETEDQKAAKAAKCMHVHAVKEDKDRLNRDMYVAVAFDQDGRDHAVFGESAEQMSSRSGNMKHDLSTDKVWYFLFIKGRNMPITQTKEEIDARIAKEQAMKGKREAAVDMTKPDEASEQSGPVYNEKGAETSGLYM